MTILVCALMQGPGLRLLEPWYIAFALKSINKDCDLSWAEECSSRDAKIAARRGANT